MNEFVLAKFTPQVLLGAEKFGLKGKTLRAVLGVSEARLAELMYGLEDLDARTGKRLEDRTGVSVSELALLGVAREATPAQLARHKALIRDTLAMLACARTGEPFTPSRKRTVKRPPPKTKRSRSTRARAA